MLQISLDWDSTVHDELNWKILELGAKNINTVHLHAPFEAIGNKVVDLSKEEINCRRLQKHTRKHKELTAEINRMIVAFDQAVLMTHLSN